MVGKKWGEAMMNITNKEKVLEEMAFQKDDMGRGLVDIMGRYTTTFLWLQQYDEGLLKEPGGFPGGILPTPSPID